ncbi:MAG TPA: hypothetical protein DD473_03440 [Planctomycetaceae bacterium]|nr:hypothetical protein [Planctomycetaceae bacterium]
MVVTGHSIVFIAQGISPEFQSPALSKSTLLHPASNLNFNHDQIFAPLTTQRSICCQTLLPCS